MPLTARLLALLVAVTWGLNFVAIHASLEQFPPLLCAAVRFAVIAVPVVLFVPRPRGVPLRWLLAYGAGFGVAQFVFLYTAMAVGMPAGLASLVLQSSAPFTVVLAGVLLRERLSGRQVAGVVVAVAGLAGIAASRAELGGTDVWTTLLPVVLTLLGGLGWAFGNLGSRLAWRERMALGQPPTATESLRLVLWVSVVPPLPLALASLVLEGPARIGAAFTGLGSRTGLLAIAGLAFTVLIATLVGQVVWSALMARHPSSSVAPFSMLVPVVGMVAAHVLLGEATPWREVALGAVVVGGVLLGASRPRRRPSAPTAPAPEPALSR
ncbi:EamA family transporter [Quadrisphaera setariae]|uniref:EamA family transporter n=1 Tax=Quadrisphaera setariae TaxID=2593304 RepID=A0A5C8Z529_9ACTN|nr:EamA family transporter [Quadrisphaera setariae]TXR52717.1 EamA family transporter [Quadrisphaera setariae]